MEIEPLARHGESPGAPRRDAKSLPTVSDTVPTPETLQAALSGLQNNETNDAYRLVVARLNDRWRVIVSHDRPPCRQWILQQRVRVGRRSWENRSFCQKRETLLRCIREKITGPSCKPQAIDPDALASIAALPERIPQDALP